MKKNKTTILTVLAIIVAVGVIWLAVSQSSDQKESTVQGTPPLQGEQIPILEPTHVQNGTQVDDYNSNPPTSGKHYSSPTDWGAYSVPIPDEIVVHNLEHGGIWISYKDIDDNARARLADIAEIYNQAVVVTPRPQNDTVIALASWGRLQKLDAFDANSIETFIRANVNNSPERFASLEKVQVIRGKQVPDATFTTLDGEEVTLSELKGQKVMFWFLATWCPSCIVGAQELERNNDGLGDLTIVALETFGNAGFPGPSMREFALENSPTMLGAPNWIWGEASEEATIIYNPRDFPDVYFLVDEDGVLRDIDTAPAATMKKLLEFANG